MAIPGADAASVMSAPAVLEVELASTFRVGAMSVSEIRAAAKTIMMTAKDCKLIALPIKNVSAVRSAVSISAVPK
jgi:hypothetical protein